MLAKIGVGTLEELLEQTIPSRIRLESPLDLPPAMSESEYLEYLQGLASKNKVFKTYIGQGYYDTHTPSVIKRNMLENPSWYTSYTPYQAEIAQGRLEALLNYQTLVMDLTGMEIANASLLDEASAAAESMIMQWSLRGKALVKADARKYFVDQNTFAQTLAVLETRANPLGIELVVGDFASFANDGCFFGALVQYPAADGQIRDYERFAQEVHSWEGTLCVAADILSLVLLRPPAQWGADVVVGSTQRFGIPMGYGGPHAAFFATHERFKRSMPGRIIGVSKDRHGNPAMRMALQTREQHIRREKATSNICTAQALLANMASMYAVFHGAEGLERIARGVHASARALADALAQLGFASAHADFFDTLLLRLPKPITAMDIQGIALDKGINFHYPDQQSVGLSINETTTLADLNDILGVFAQAAKASLQPIERLPEAVGFDPKFKRAGAILQEKVFSQYRSETEMMRYIKRLERKDFSLTDSMISLGSCTMKLNAASEMLALSWKNFSALHPFVPTSQAEGYQQIFRELKSDLSKITGFADISLQPNSGATGEHTGLLVIDAYHRSLGQGHRDLVLIPSSAHGTNPASAVMVGKKVVVVNCDSLGNIDIEDLRAKAAQAGDRLSAFMVTYPSTHGVFEEEIMEMCAIVHAQGGQVYMDGANMNAQVGLTSPARIGADVCHLNLHKTFAIPHGGGGPGVGPIGVAPHLVKFLPTHPVVKVGGSEAVGPVAAAPWGSASILLVSHGYIRMLGGQGLTESTRLAILNANYLAASLKDHYGILYTNRQGRVAHEMILECRQFKDSANISVPDIAKRLMDYGFHAPTLSFPVAGTLMVEPTESESLQELDRFVQAMLSIHAEIIEVRDGQADREDNVLRNAPHTAHELTSDDWAHAYSRQKAAYPLPWTRRNKIFPSVARVDDAHGDRNLVCSCEPIQSYMEPAEA